MLLYILYIVVRRVNMRRCLSTPQSHLAVSKQSMIRVRIQEYTIQLLLRLEGGPSHCPTYLSYVVAKRPSACSRKMKYIRVPHEIHPDAIVVEETPEVGEYFPLELLD